LVPAAVSLAANLYRAGLSNSLIHQRLLAAGVTPGAIGQRFFLGPRLCRFSFDFPFVVRYLEECPIVCEAAVRLIRISISVLARFQHCPANAISGELFRGA